MRQYIYTLCALLLLAAPLHAAETLDEKVYDPRQTTPPASPAPVVPTIPGQTVPTIPGGAQGDTIIVVPTTPGQPMPGQSVPSQTEPSQPDTQKETPAIVVPPVPSVPSVPSIPAIPAVPAIPVIPVIPSIPEPPKAPETEKKDIIVTPVQPVTPEEKKELATPVPPTPKAEDKLLTPADFLPTTPEKKDSEKTEAKPDPQKDKAKPTPKQDTKQDPKQDSKPDPKPDPKKDKPTPEKKKGEALRIPPEAAKSGNMDFLEGCWKGRLSGRAGNDVIDNMGSRFCFDDKGKGKHFLYDPKRNETCVGSANGGVKADGTLRVDFDNLYCPSGETWYPQGDKYMTCRDGGNGAECKWYYKGKPKTTGPFHRD